MRAIGQDGNAPRAMLLTCFSWRAPAVEAAHSVDASGAIEASSASAVIDIDAAVGASPAVNTDAGEAANGVGASGAVLAHAGPLSALVHVLLAQLPHVRGRTHARVPVDVVDTRRPVLAQVARTIVDVLLTVLTAVTCSTRTRTSPSRDKGSASLQDRLHTAAAAAAGAVLGGPALH
jgi:hypothetical protein